MRLQITCIPQPNVILVWQGSNLADGRSDNPSSYLILNSTKYKLSISLFKVSGVREVNGNYRQYGNIVSYLLTAV